MMNSEHSGSKQSSSLSTLVGYITGPKAEQPVGVRVVEPPSGTRQKQRGKLYAMVDLLDDHRDGAEISDHLLTVIQRTYYTAKGSQSNVMIESLRRAHQVIQEINQQYPDSALRAGVLCAALLNDRLVIVASGSAMALVRTNDQVQMFPSELSTTPAFDGDVPMQIFRQKLGPDDAFFLGSARWTQIVSIKTLAGIVAYVNEQNCTEAADELYAQSGEGAPPGCFIVMMDRQQRAGAAASLSAQNSTDPGGNGTSRFFGLPTAVNIAPPRQSGSQAKIQPAPTRIDPPEPDRYYPDTGTLSGVLSSRNRYARIENQSAGAFSPDPDSDEPQSYSTARQYERSLESEADRVDSSTFSDPYLDTYTDFETYGNVSTASDPYPSETDDSGVLGDEVAAGSENLAFDQQTLAHDNSWSQRMSVAAVAGMHQTKRFLKRMLPDGGEQTDSENDLDAEDDDPAPVDTSFAPSVPQQYPVDAVESEKPHYGPKISPPPLPDIEPFSPPKPTTGARARLLILLALIIIILVPAIVFGLHYGPGRENEHEADLLTDAAQAQYDSALTSFNQEDKARAREALVDAKDYLTKAIALEGSTQQRLLLAANIEQLLQDVLQVQPLYSLVSPLVTFPADANPHRVLVADSSIYVLDNGRQAILRYRYDPTSGDVVGEEPQVVLRMGDNVEGATVGTLGDMAWLPLNPGFADKPTLLILDRNNNLFSYDPRVEGARRFELGGEEYWQSASQVQTFNGRIYVADEGTNAIYRYSPGQTYTEPDNWFQDDTLVNLAGALSMEIDGDIWLLLGSGNIMRYQDGEQLPFSLENSVGLAEDPVDMYVAKEGSERIYLVDAGDDRILVYDKNGAYDKQLLAPEGDPLRGLSGLYIDEIDGTMFILTKSALYSHPLL